jgi:hypothetical protein
MFRRMVEVYESDEDECVICLERLDEERGTVKLSDKFGCDCKQKVHQDCLTIWIIRKAKNMRRNAGSCIMCRQEVEMGSIKRSDLNNYVLSNIVVDSDDIVVDNVVQRNMRREPYTLRDVVRMLIGGSIMFGLIAVAAMALLGVFRK